MNRFKFLMSLTLIHHRLIYTQKNSKITSSYSGDGGDGVIGYDRVYKSLKKKFKIYQVYCLNYINLILVLEQK